MEPENDAKTEEGAIEKKQSNGTIQGEIKNDLPEDLIDIDFQIYHQQDQIRQAVNQSAFVGPLEGMNGLKTEYGTNQNFLRKIQDLEAKYDGFRRVRGDGSCFYRSYFFGLMVYLTKDQNVALAFEEKMGASLDKLVKQGFDGIAIEDFHEVMMDEIKWVRTEKPSEEDIVGHFNRMDISESIVTYARFLCSYALQVNTEDYSPYLPDGKTLLEFIKEEVEPTNRECDYLQCVALANEIGIGVVIEYLDQSSGPLNSHTLPYNSTPCVHLLYKPGHYDILYQK